MKSDTILRIVNEIQASPPEPEARRAIFGRKYPKFQERYPGIFYKATENTMDVKILSMMLNKLNTVGGEEEVGQTLFQQFVSPSLQKKMKDQARGL